MSAPGFVVVGALALALAAPASSTAEPGPPKELWSEYPLESSRTGSSSPTAPFTPPVRAESSPQLPIEQAVPESSPTTSPLWPALLALLVLLTLAAVAVASGVVPAGIGQRLRPERRHVPRRTSRPIAQHAPLVPRRADPPEERPAHGSIRRTGLVRGRFELHAEGARGGRRRIASSRPFWRLGGGQGAERHAWVDLLRNLEADDWMLDLGASTPDEIRLSRSSKRLSR